MDKKEEKKEEKKKEKQEEQVQDKESSCENCECDDKEKEKIQEILKQVQDDKEQCEHKYKRALADYQNLEKRVREERIHWIKTANRDLILRMLPVLDTLMLAQNHSDDQTIKVTTQQFLDLLKNEGVEKIKTEGELFSPHLMEAISTEEVDPSTGSGQLENKVLKELRAGYKIGDTVLRVAQVVVGSAKQN